MTKKLILFAMYVMCVAIFAAVSCSPAAKVNPQTPQNEHKPGQEETPQVEQQIKLRLSNIQCETPTSGSTSYTFTYDEGGRLIEFADAFSLKWTFEYIKDTIRTISPITSKQVSLSLEKGRVVESKIWESSYSQYDTFDWTYDKSGYLVSVLSRLDPKENYPIYVLNPLELEYSDGNLKRLDFGKSEMFEIKYEYDKDNAVNTPVGNFNPTMFFNYFNLIYGKEDYMLAVLLNVAGETSRKVPVSLYRPVEGVGFSEFPIDAAMEDHTFRLSCNVPNENVLFYNKLIFTYEKF